MDQSNKTHITLIQLGRIGDLLQTLQSISSPIDLNINFTLICRKSFGKPLSHLLEKHFKHIHYIDTDALFTGNPSLSLSTDRLNNIINEINQQSHDALINLTFSKPAAFLMSLLDSEVKIGQVFQGSQNFEINDSWGQYVYSNIMTGPHSTFNLVDIMRKMIGLPFSLKQEREKKSSSSDSKKIVINPFASHSKKFWKASKWAKLINLLSQNPQFQLILVGADSEKELAAQILNLLTPECKKSMENLVGHTTIEQLGHTLKDADLFIGHDSMTSHLAAIYQTQTLTISLGTVRATETIPYGHHHYTLVPHISCFPCFPSDPCSNFECHDQIPEELASNIADLIVNNKNIEEFESDKSTHDLWNTCSLYRSEVTDLSLRTRRVTSLPMTSQEIINDFYHHCWLFIFSDQEGQLDFPHLNSSLCIELEKHLEGFEYLFDISGFGKQFSNTIVNEAKQKKPNNKVITEQSEKLKELEGLTQSIKKQYPILTPLINFTTLELRLNNGQDLYELAQNSLLSYHQLNLSISIIHDFISKSIQNFENQNKAHLAK